MTAEILLIYTFWSGQDSYEISLSNSTVVGSKMGRKLIIIIINLSTWKKNTVVHVKNIKI